MKTNEKRRTPEEEEEEDEKKEEEERERRENDSQHTQRDLYKTHIESISEREKTSSSSIRTTTTTTPFSVSLEDIYIYIEGLWIPLVVVVIKALGREANWFWIVIYRHENIIAFFFF